MKNREIKFRVWDTENTKWSSVRNLLLNRIGKEKIYNFTQDEYKRFIIQGFTGLKDKNKKEIYEGDILEDENNYKYEVFWLDTNSSFELAEKQEPPDGYREPVFNLLNTFRLRIVGNIFENPEVLQKTS